jgi:hypothetical protein
LQNERTSELRTRQKNSLLTFAILSTISLAKFHNVCAPIISTMASTNKQDLKDYSLCLTRILNPQCHCNPVVLVEKQILTKTALTIFFCCTLMKLILVSGTGHFYCLWQPPPPSKRSAGPCSSSCSNPCSSPCSNPCSNPCSSPCSNPCSSPCSNPCSSPCSSPCSPAWDRQKARGRWWRLRRQAAPTRR